MPTVERPLNAYRGSTMVVVEVFIAVVAFLLFAVGVDAESPGLGALGILLGLIGFFILAGFLVVQPN